MRKYQIAIAMLISGIGLSNALAATPNTPTSIGGVPIPTPPNNGQVMSNDAFKGKVDQFGAETTSKLNQTVQQQIKASASGSPQTPPPSSTSTSTNTQTAPGTDADSTSQTDSGGQPAAQPDNRPAMKPAAPVMPAAPQQSSQPASSADTYTGFGGTQPKQGNSSSSGSDKKSGGWNVGY